MTTPTFLALAADKKRRLRTLRRERLARPLTAALEALLVAYAWGVLGLAAALVIGPLALASLPGALWHAARGRA